MVKTLLLTLFTLTVLSAKAQTNVYNPFPDTKGLWHERLYSGSHQQYGIIGDTIINSMTWHKIYLELNCLTNLAITTANSNLVGAIREDSAKRVFFYNFSLQYTTSAYNSVSLLYDFSVQAGDTVKYGSIQDYAYENLVVDSIDSVFMYDHYRKRFYLSPFNQVWVEGIGSMRAFCSSIIPYTTCGCDQDLFCFSNNDTTYFIIAPYLDCYDLSVGVKEIQQGNAISVYPNPFSNETTLTTTENMKDATLTIYNLYGQAVKELKNISGQTHALPREGLQSGVYYISLKDGNKTVTTDKLVVNDN